jgi:hypothetical protein
MLTDQIESVKMYGTTTVKKYNWRNSHLAKLQSHQTNRYVTKFYFLSTIFDKNTVPWDGIGWDGTKILQNHPIPWDDFFVPSHAEPCSITSLATRYPSENRKDIG